MTDVIVVGAGPTGLLLANELALAGIDVTVLERLPHRTGQSKALALQPRSTELLALRGLADPLLAQASARIPGGHFAGIPLDYSTLDTRFPFQLGIAQARVEDLLERELAGKGVSPLYGTPVVSLHQDGSGVTVGTADGQEHSARYMVGCDGGRSTVRGLLGVPFEGRDPRMSAIVADLTVTGEGAPSTWELPSFDGPVAALIPLPDGAFRLLAAGAEQQSAGRDDPVTVPEVRRALAQRYSLELTEVRWASRFTDTTRQVSRYRTGRVFLAGDAAHVHSPTGGQGLNLGLQDAFNLGWKLAAALKGTGDLLDSYHDERHPVGAAVLASTRAQGVLLWPDGDVAALRATFTDLLEEPAANHRLAGQISGLSIHYGPDPVVGARVPEACLHEGQWALLPGDRFGAERILVRPDGHVGWAGTAADSARAARELGRMISSTRLSPFRAVG